MIEQLEFAKKRLFDKDSMGTENIKLFLGSNRNTSSEEFAVQINKSLSLIETGDFEEASFED